MKRIGLTGANGVMGQTLQQSFPATEWIPFESEILDPSALASWLQSAGKLDGVIHLAAIVPVHLVEEDPIKALRVNVEGTCRLLEAIGKFYPQGSAPWIFLASSCHVYASSAKRLTEDSPLDPVSLYGLTKLHAEQWGERLAKKLNLELCMGRIFSSHSPLHPDSYFIPSMIRKISQAPQGARLEVRGLMGTRDFQTAQRVCAAIHFLMEKRAQGVFNIASGVSVQLLELVREIQRRLGREDVQIVPLDQDVSHLNANVDKLRKLGFQPKADLADLLGQVLD